MDLLQRCNTAAQEQARSLGSSFKVLDEDSVVSYVRQMVKQRVKFKQKQKGLRTRVQELEAKIAELEDADLAELEKEIEEG